MKSKREKPWKLPKGKTLYDLHNDLGNLMENLTKQNLGTGASHKARVIPNGPDLFIP